MGKNTKRQGEIQSDEMEKKKGTEYVGSGGKPQLRVNVKSEKAKKSKLFHINFFQQIYQRVENHRHDAEKYDRHQEPIHFEELGGHLEYLDIRKPLFPYIEIWTRYLDIY